MRDRKYSEKIKQIEAKIDANFTRKIIDDIIKSPHGQSTLAKNLNFLELIRVNELSIRATYIEGHPSINHPNEKKKLKWTNKLYKEPIEYFKANKETFVKGLDDKNNLTWLLIGNSHGMVLSRCLQEEFKYNYSYFYTFVATGCLPFYVPNNLAFLDPGNQMPLKFCSSYSQVVKEIIKELKPDYLFISFRWYSSFKEQPFNENSIENDQILSLINSFVQNIQPLIKKKIFFPAPHLHFKNRIAMDIARAIWLGKSLEFLHLSYTEHLKNNYWSYLRLKYLNCSKCTIYDFSQYFCNSTRNVCLAFDETNKLAYFYDDNHFNYFGSEFIRPFIRSLF